MKSLYNEQDIWVSKDKKVTLTTHRLREIHKRAFGSSIKSIMLENITSCQLRTHRQYKYLSMAILFFLLLNGSVYLLNQFLFKAELIKILFGEVHIGAITALKLFNISLTIGTIFITLFFLSVKKVFSFFSNGTTVEFQLRRLKFEEREDFINKVEEAKEKRMQYIYQQK